MPGKILLIDDEAAIIDLLTIYLSREGYEVISATDGPSGLNAARTFRPDLIVLDVMLPGLDGIELLRQLRRDSDVYVIMLTARAEEHDKLIGLAVGADDYLTKPYSPRELVARVKAAFRRMQGGMVESAPPPLVFQHLRIDPGSHEVWVNGEPVDLTHTEYELLYALAQHPRIVLSRDQLLERVWGHDFYGEERVVDVHLGHVRRKLGIPGLIRTVRGAGFRFEDVPG